MQAYYKHDGEINGTNCEAIAGKVVEGVKALSTYLDGDVIFRVEYEGKEYIVWESCLEYLDGETV